MPRCRFGPSFLPVRDSKSQRGSRLWRQNTDNRQTHNSTKSVANKILADISEAQEDETDETQTLLPKDETISRFRQTLPQVLAVSVSGLLFLSIGMVITFPSVVIPVLTKESIDSSLHFSEEEASWYGSILYFSYPIGTLMSGVLLQPVGCKNLMLLLNIPLLTSWLMAYFATSSTIMCISTALSGFAQGLMEPPAIRYTSEVSNPSLRGILMTYATTFLPIGYFVTYLLAAFVDWRHVALISALVPIICVVSLPLVPETPIWLMSKGRPEDALKSLRWLQGWTSAEMVKNEYMKLEFYSKVTPKAPNECEKKTDEEPNMVEGVDDNAQGGNTVNLDSKEEHQQRDLKEVWQVLTSRGTLVLMAKCIALFILSTFSRRNAMTPYQLQIFAKMNLPIDPNTIGMSLSLASVAGNIACLLLVKRTGKKPLGIFAFMINSICICLIGVYLTLPTRILEQDSTFYGWCAVILFFLNYFIHNTGITPVMMTYLGELLPHRGRGISTGIVMGVFLIAIAVGAKTFPAMVEHLGLHGIFFVYAVLCVVGALFIHFALPETDAKFLSDIEIELTHAKDNATLKESQTYTVKSLRV